MGKSAAWEANYKSQSASRRGLSSDCSRHCKALLLAQSELLLRLRPARERFLQLRLRERSASAWCPSQQARPALLCSSERLARVSQPPLRATVRREAGLAGTRRGWGVLGTRFPPHIGISSLLVKYKQVACLQIALQVSEASLSSISSDNGVRRAVLYYNDLPNSPRIVGVEKKNPWAETCTDISHVG